MARVTRFLRFADNRQNLAGVRVQERRLALNMRQDELTAQLSALTGGQWDPSYQEISRLESGHRMVTDVELAVLSVALDADVSWLLLGSAKIDSTLQELLVCRIASNGTEDYATLTAVSINMVDRKRGPRRPK